MNPLIEETERRLDRAVMYALDGKVGVAHRMSREALLAYLRSNHSKSVTDRGMREAIERLRNQDELGSLICSTSANGGGYWIAETMQELLTSYRQERRRALTELVTIRQRLAHGRAVLGGQLRML